MLWQLKYFKLLYLNFILAHPFTGKFYDYEDQNAPILNRFDGKTLVLTLPENIEVKDLKWLSVWCRRFAINFGDFRFNVEDTTDRFETTTEEIGKFWNIEIKVSQPLYII